MESLFLRSKSAVAAVSADYQRALMQEVHWLDPLIFILGPRGVGKTTLLLQRLRALELPPRQALYVDLGMYTSRPTSRSISARCGRPSL